MASDRALKFLCSYGGKIMPRPIDGELRYFGGFTRILTVDRSISHAELMVKLGEFCGYCSVTLKSPLPCGDLETLISITSDEDLALMLKEYDLASASLPHPLKIRAILWPRKSLKKISRTPSTSSADPISNASRAFFNGAAQNFPPRAFVQQNFPSRAGQLRAAPAVAVKGPCPGPGRYRVSAMPRTCQGHYCRSWLQTGRNYPHYMRC